jgi:hypothetical protein
MIFCSSVSGADACTHSQDIVNAAITLLINAFVGDPHRLSRVEAFAMIAKLR